MAHRAGSGDDGNRRRDAWLQQFIFAFANDEAEESTSFQGTIPQALMMMNGELMQTALSGKPGSFLGDVIEQARRQGRSPEAYMVDSIYLAALSRHPSAKELARARQYLEAYPGQPPGLARPVLGPPQFQRVCLESLRLEARSRDTPRRAGEAVARSSPARWRSIPLMSDVPRPFNQMTRRHWLGHLASTAWASPRSSSSRRSRPMRNSSASPTGAASCSGWAGGPSHLDIWDLKPDSEKNGGPFRPIDTSAPGVKISEHLPKVAKQMHHLSILRSLDSKEGNHDRGTYLMHTGYAPNPTVVHPGWGSVCAMELGETARALRPAALHRDQLAGRRGGIPGDVVCPVRRPEPERPDRQSSAPQGRRELADGAPARDAGPGRRPIHQPASRSGGRRSQGGLRQDAADDELALSRLASTSIASRPMSATRTAAARSARVA